jgi:hypothetical protein
MTQAHLTASAGVDLLSEAYKAVLESVEEEEHLFTADDMGNLIEN